MFYEELNSTLSTVLPPTDLHVASHIWPLDEHNIELLNHVHPTGWVNAKAESKYDLVVIGGGPAGLVTAAGAAGVGARVALIEANFLGGDCLNQVCIQCSMIHSSTIFLLRCFFFHFDVCVVSTGMCALKDSASRCKHMPYIKEQSTPG